jgi:hypothetical protein
MPRRLLPPLLLAGLIGCGPRIPDDVAEAFERLPEKVDYNYHIKPILSDRCYKCHGPDDRAREADLRLDTRDYAMADREGRPAIDPGSRRGSELVHRILSDDPHYRMPTPESNLSLTAEEKAYLIRWIDQGAEYKPHWSLIPPEKPTLPKIRQAGWPRNEIDHFILARLEQEGLSPSPEAAKETLLRRATFDLTGLPPTLAEIDAFLADTAPDAWERVIDRLLASPAFGERLATEWLDVARYADSHGYQDDGMRNMWPWRDWVIDAFNRNLPFDQFVTWQLAGDLLPQPTHEQVLATGFNRNHLQSQEGGIVPEEYRVDYVADRTQTFGKAFLGLTLECARCHDHKYDPITQREYYQLFAFFNSVNEFGNIPYAGEASPVLLLPSSEADSLLAPLRAQIRDHEARLQPEHPSFDAGFEAWLSKLEAKQTPAQITPQGLLAHYPLDGLPPSNQLANRVAGAPAAYVWGDLEALPQVVEGKVGKALAINGNSVIDAGNRIAYFERNEPFTVGLWIKLNRGDFAEEVPLVGKAGGYFNGLRGYLVMRRTDGTLSASVNHVFPDNSIEVVSQQPLPVGRWCHLVMTYDGSSRASGLKLYLDGQPMPTRIRVDHLQQSTLHRVDPRTGEVGNWGDPGNLRLGYVESNMPKLDSTAVDELKVFDRALTALEVAALAGVPDPLGTLVSIPRARRTPAQQAALREYYVCAVDPGFRREFAVLTTLRGEENAITTRQPSVMVMRDLAQPRLTRVLHRGQYDAPRDTVAAATPAALLAFPDDLPRNRLGLARWLFDARHPLTARVAVNRYWQMLFGRGLVATPDDFGNQGALPSHPELLDYLATAFVASGWDVKVLLKQMVRSATYRQASRATPLLLERDPQNLLLARGPSYRLPAEMLRDNALAVSGRLVRTLGGPPVHPYQPAGLWKELATRNVTEYVQGQGDDLYRRSLYTVWKRTSPPPSMMSFDAPERNFCTVRRQSTSTPLQALVLLNDPQYLEAARLLAERILREGGASPDDRLTYAFRLLTSRRPTPREVASLQALYAAEHQQYTARPDDARALLALGEHPRDPALPLPDVAALTIVVNTLMNYDEAYMKR